MTGLLKALRLPHLIGIGAVVAVLAGGLPSHWFGLASSKLTEVERLESCMQKHGGVLASIVTSLGTAQKIAHETPAQRAHAARVAEHRGRLQREQARAVEACARTVVPSR